MKTQTSFLIWKDYWFFKFNMWGVYSVIRLPKILKKGKTVVLFKMKPLYLGGWILFFT